MKNLDLPTCSDNHTGLLHDGRRAVAVESDDARGLALPSILVMHRRLDRVGSIARALEIDLHKYNDSADMIDTSWVRGVINTGATSVMRNRTSGLQ